MNKLFKMVVEFFNSLAQAIKKIFCPKETRSRMETWAEREIDLACKRERAAGSAADEDWDYGCACYESAYKAFQSLMADGHSGMSICFTKDILNRLIDGKPLTPIEDTPDVWNDISDISGLRGEKVSYQCKRMSSLFKYVYADGRVEYWDIDAYVGIDDNGGFHSGLIDSVMEKLYPITMPYSPPSKPTKVYCEDVLTDRKNGDFDTRAIHYAIRPNGERIEINQYFKEGEKNWEPILKEEFLQRLEMQNMHLADEKLRSGNTLGRGIS